MDNGDELARRLAALEDERAILRTMYTYGHAIDYGREDEWVDGFAEHARYTVRVGDQTGNGSARVFQGRGEIRSFVQAHTRAPGAWHKHLLSEPIVDVDGDHATAVSYFLRVDGQRGVNFIRGFGRYHDEFARGQDGRWRFESRLAEVEGVDFGPDA